MGHKPLLHTLLASSLTAFIFFFSTQAHAGECKIKDPEEAMLLDAVRMTVIFDLQMSKIADEYKKETGKDLKVAFVARAGQDLRNLKVLHDTDSSGRYMTQARMVETARQSTMPIGDGMMIDDASVKRTIESMYWDKQKKVVYSHVGIALWNHPHGRDSEDSSIRNWWFRHLLRPCADPNAKEERDYNVPLLWDEGPGRFFADDPFELRAQILIPTPELQDQLEKMTLTNKTALAFNGKFYNAVAHWQNDHETNSNQWVLELLAAASQAPGRVTNRAEAQDILEKTGYRPTRVLFYGKQTLLGLPFASKFVPYVRLHSKEQPYAAGGINMGEVITALSLEEYLKKNGWLHNKTDILIQEKTKLSKPSSARDQNRHDPFSP
ncbi:MAG: DUF2145 domain-containing protein [Bdellovibrionales bacterium]|jgi:hypothetical protein|nr:DUF2145 domain-containing protein [Bdellovibrionales bacterium]